MYKNHVIKNMFFILNGLPNYSTFILSKGGTTVDETTVDETTVFALG
jgi:hypothetical protein